MSIKGKAIGETCPSCKRGRLLPVLRDMSGVKSGHVIASDIPIERLACDACAVSCEAQDRGASLREIRERQLKPDFLNPETFPKLCGCGGEAVLATRFSLVASRDLRYLHCERCQTVLWIDGARERPRRIAEAPDPQPAACA